MLVLVPVLVLEVLPGEHWLEGERLGEGGLPLRLLCPLQVAAQRASSPFAWLASAFQAWCEPLEAAAEPELALEAAAWVERGGHQEGAERVDVIVS